MEPRPDVKPVSLPLVKWFLAIPHYIVLCVLALGAVLQQVFISGTYSAGLPRDLYLALSVLSAVAGLTAYRILLVWLYDRTGSLLLTTLMHASLTANTIFIFRPEAAGLAFLAYSWAFTAATWVVVAAVALVTGGELSGVPGAGRIRARPL